MEKRRVVVVTHGGTVWKRNGKKNFPLSFLKICVKETYDADVGCTEDGRNGRIGATRYAGGNGTRKEAEKRNV